MAAIELRNIVKVFSDKRRGRDLLTRCPVCLFAGSLVPSELLEHCPASARIIDTAPMTLDQIEAEARLDGIYVIRTSMPAEHLDAAETVQAYKDLSRVERAFRSLKSVDLEIRPIRHWTADRVRAHVFLCMLAYHVEWHLRDALAPLLFHDTDMGAAKAERTSPVAATEPSDAVKAKKATRRSTNGQRVMSFADLLAHLGTLVRNTMRVPARPKHRFTLHSRPTALQEAAFALLELDPVRVQ